MRGLKPLMKWLRLPYRKTHGELRFITHARLSKNRRHGAKPMPHESDPFGSILTLVARPINSGRRQMRCGVSRGSLKRPYYQLRCWFHPAAAFMRTGASQRALMSIRLSRSQRNLKRYAYTTASRPTRHVPRIWHPSYVRWELTTPSIKIFPPLPRSTARNRFRLNRFRNQSITQQVHSRARTHRKRNKHQPRMMTY